MTRRRRTKPHAKRGSVSISVDTYERLTARVGKELGERGQISRVVDKIISDYIDRQEGK